jgi:hypothetical protein
MRVRAASRDRETCGPMGSGVFPILLALALMGLVVVAHAPAAHAATSVDSTATLTWSAPGDDGTSGRAARYEMRYRSVAIAGTDTASWWNAAATVAAMPAPGASGTVDSVQVHGLDPTLTWYFILRTADEVPNWSYYSNAAIRSPYVDAVAPAAIADLGPGATTPSGAVTPVNMQGAARSR